MRALRHLDGVSARNLLVGEEEEAVELQSAFRFRLLDVEEGRELYRSEWLVGTANPAWRPLGTVVLERDPLERALEGSASCVDAEGPLLAPWAPHRNAIYWPNADRFDPDRFSPENEAQLVPGTYMPFGLGQRICVGAAFATFESCLILARLVRRYDFEALDPGKVRPVARLTTRPAKEIMVRVRRR